MHQVRSLLLVQELCLLFGTWCQLTFNIENWIKDPDIPQKGGISQYLLFLHESFSSEFHVFVTFQTSQLDAGIWRVLQALLPYRRCILALQSFILSLANNYSPEPNWCFLLLRLLSFLSLYQAEKCSEIGTVSKYKTCLIIANLTCTFPKELRYLCLPQRVAWTRLNFLINSEDG